jgi:hypothetical protein
LAGEGRFSASTRKRILRLVRFVKDDYAITAKPSLNLVYSFLSRFGCGDKR